MYYIATLFISLGIWPQGMLNALQIFNIKHMQSFSDMEIFIQCLLYLLYDYIFIMQNPFLRGALRFIPIILLQQISD